MEDKKILTKKEEKKLARNINKVAKEEKKKQAKEAMLAKKLNVKNIKISDTAIDNAVAQKEYKRAQLKRTICGIICGLGMIAGILIAKEESKKAKIGETDPKPQVEADNNQYFDPTNDKDVIKVATTFMETANKLDNVEYTLDEYKDLVRFLNGQSMSDNSINGVDGVIDMLSNLLNQEDIALINSINVEKTPETTLLLDYSSLFSNKDEQFLINHFEGLRINLLNNVKSQDKEQMAQSATSLFYGEVDFVWDNEILPGISREDVSTEAQFLILNLLKHGNNAIVSINNNFSITKNYVKDKENDSEETIYLKDFSKNAVFPLDQELQKDIYATYNDLCDEEKIDRTLGGK